MNQSQNRRRSSNRSHTDRKATHNTHRKRRPRRRGKSFASKIGKALLIVCVIVAFAVAGAGLGTVFGILQSTEMLNTADILPESYTSVLYDADGNEIDKLHGAENREYVKLSATTKNMQNAVVAIEDERFYEHNGIDMRGIARAVFENVKSFHFSQGASTITQQVIKNELLGNEKKLERKIKEQYLAVSLEKALRKQLGTKEEAKKYVLELYLNTISLHHGLRGVETAALYYFGKHASELTLAECACIAGITKNPSLYAPDANPEESRKRQLTVLSKMQELGFITQEEYDLAAAEDVFGHLVCKNAYEEEGNAKHNYFVEAAIDQIAKDLMEQKSFTKAQAYNKIYSGGLQIHLTMDSDMQKITETALKNDSLFPSGDGMLDVIYLISVLDTTNPDENTNQTHYEKRTMVRNQSEADAFIESVKAELLDDTHTLVLDKVTISKSLQAAMVIMDQQNGEVKALVGGRGEKPGDSVFNRATQALRQQGSTFKPLAAYAPAIDTGLLMPGSIIIDEPVKYGSWAPKNWDGRFAGPTTVRKGIWHSMNVLAVKTFMMVGADVSFEYLQKFGFTTLTDNDKGGAVALGGLTQGVSVLEETAAYASIANGGVYHQPVYYTVIYDHDGNVLLDNNQAETHRVLKETTAYMLTDMMRDVITKGTGTQAAISGMTVAGKTGTTNDTKDLTFYGYTPYYTGGIWMGYDTAKEIKGSGNAHLKIWRTVMSQIHQNKGLTNKKFEKPEGLVNVSFCGVSGKTATGLCEQDYYGHGLHSDIAAADFKGDTGICDLHKSYTICKHSGKLASANCPESYKMDVVLAVGSDGKILGKPEGGEGKLDIDVSTTCTSDHSVRENPLDDTPAQTGNTTPSDQTELPIGIDTPISDDDWNEHNFGIQ